MENFKPNRRTAAGFFGTEGKYAELGISLIDLDHVRVLVLGHATEQALPAEVALRY